MLKAKCNHSRCTKTDVIKPQYFPPQIALGGKLPYLDIVSQESGLLSCNSATNTNTQAAHASPVTSRPRSAFVVSSEDSGACSGMSGSTGTMIVGGDL